VYPKYVFHLCIYVLSVSLSLSCVVCGCRPTLSRGRPTRAHTRSFYLGLSLTLLTFLPFKKALRRRYDHHWNTRFVCIRLFSFHKGSTNTKLLVLTSLDQLISKLKILFSFFIKQPTLMRRSTVLILPLQLVFPGFFIIQLMLFGSRNGFHSSFFQQNTFKT
jgi:hypothetical protein